MKNLSKIILHTPKENCGQDNATPTSKKMYGYSIGSKKSSSPTLSKKLVMYVPNYTQGVVIKNF